MRVKAIVALRDFDELSEETQWHHRREIASDVFQKYRNGEALPANLCTKIGSVVDDDSYMIPIVEQIAHFKDIKDICRNFYYAESGIRLHPDEIEHIVITP